MILGSNSETAYLTEDEKLTPIKSAVQTVKKDHLIMVGTGMETTRETIKLTNKAAKLGAQMTSEALINISLKQLIIVRYQY